MKLRPACALLPAFLALGAWAPAARATEKKISLAGKVPPAMNAAPGTKAAPAPKIQKAPQAAAPLPAVRVIQYVHETVAYPGYWTASPKTKDLVRAEFYYRWDMPGRSCDNDTFPWAHVAISNDIAPCWTPDREYYRPVKKMLIDGFMANLYRRKPLPPGDPEISSPDSCPGQSNMVLNFTVANRCYTMKFLTSDKWMKKFFPDFTLIMDRFKVND